jgi:nitrite reductase/ring-hydroxylating ferredoxin subunit
MTGLPSMVSPAAPDRDQSHLLCKSSQLQDGGAAMPFEVSHAGQACRAFAIRFQGLPHAYLNRCTHVAMELDWQPNRIFDDSGEWLLCASHGAAYQPDTGQCAGGPCQGGLVKITVSERDNMVFWHGAYNLQPVLL